MPILKSYLIRNQEAEDYATGKLKKYKFKKYKVNLNSQTKNVNLDKNLK
jgi:hypothetical protein